MAVVDRKIDIILFELIKNFLYSAVDEMTLTVVRTSFSPIAREAFDFQCGICNVNGEILQEGEGTLCHSLVYPTLINNWMRDHSDSIYPEDFIVTNDPYSFAAHLPDIYMWHPIFVNEKLVAWAVAGGHLSDVGGATPGSCSCDSTEIYQEGLIIRPMKLYDRGIPNETLLSFIKANSRVPEIVLGDIEAYRSACKIGNSRIQELSKLYGWDTLNTYFEELLDYAERLTRAEIKKMPDGEYEFTDFLDNDGISPEPVKLHLKITISGNEIIYDFTGTSPQVKGALNDPFGSTQASVITGLREMLSPDIPRNSGVWRAAKLIIPEGTLLNPKLPGAVAGRGVCIARICDVQLGAEAQICPDKIPASCSQVDHLVNIGGRNEDGKPYILIEAIWGGWGGRASSDGPDFTTPPTHNCGNQPCEVNEEIYPIIYNQYGYVPNSEGAGKYRGSLALVRDWQFTGDEAILQLRTDRQLFRPYGLYGGESGSPSKSFVISGHKKRRIGKITTRLLKGDTYRLITSGAGGWGNPLERDVNKVLDDVRNEKISIGRARKVYGVVINKRSMTINLKETRKLRRIIDNKENMES